MCAYMSGDVLSPGNVNLAIGPTLHLSPAWSATTVSEICPGVEPLLPGMLASAGNRKMSPSGVWKRVFLTSATGSVEKSLYAIILPEAFCSTCVVPCAGTTSESSKSDDWTLYESEPAIGLDC